MTSFSSLGRNSQAIKELALELYGSDLPFQKIYRRKAEIASLKDQKRIPLKPGVPEILSALEDLGIRRCIATSSTRRLSGIFWRAWAWPDTLSF